MLTGHTRICVEFGRDNSPIRKISFFHFYLMSFCYKTTINYALYFICEHRLYTTNIQFYLLIPITANMNSDVSLI
jgi:hypothetical protein